MKKINFFKINHLNPKYFDLKILSQDSPYKSIATKGKPKQTIRKMDL